ncbi:hypothetical protein FRC17_009844 [Serendipita sp. 399]|nr:hypothetical protein FRC17_009844 [Serendipita sp. 399]
MPVTFKVASHEANELIDDDGEQQEWTATRVVETVWHGDGVSCQEMLQSSFIPGQETYEPRANGFVSTVVRAYNNHHHLVLRPDDIWSAILNQFSFYVNANAEALRSKFVAHEGKRELEIIADGTRYTVNFGKMATDMGDLLQKNIVDQTLREWVIPNFTTTTPNDVVICSVMMMSTLKK